MNSRERVLTACEFGKPDRIPRMDEFWDYPKAWEERLGPKEDLADIEIWVPDETPFPSRARVLKEEGAWTYSADGWGRTVKRRTDAYFYETLEVAMPAGCDIDAVEFEPADLDARFLRGQDSIEDANDLLRRDKETFCVFGKTGGPYLRSTFVRGEEQFLMDIAGDPPLAKAIADKVGDALTAVGVEAIRRWSLRDTGIWIYDDMGTNNGPMVGPKAFERVLLPAYRRMIEAYKDAGARYVVLHSDGDVRVLLDMLIDAGIDGLNPLERRANMDILEIRKRYPDLILIGGVDNTDTLVNGPVDRIAAEAKSIIDAGRDGGIVIGTHSIGPDVPLEHFVAYHETCLTYGNFSA